MSIWVESTTAQVSNFNSGSLGAVCQQNTRSLLYPNFGTRLCFRKRYYESRLLASTGSNRLSQSLPIVFLLPTRRPLVLAAVSLAKVSAYSYLLFPGAALTQAWRYDSTAASSSSSSSDKPALDWPHSPLTSSPFQRWAAIYQLSAKFSKQNTVIIV